MFYTGLDPLTMKPVYVPKSKHEKAMQRALLQYSAPRNYELVHQALVEAGREDLIGMAPRCLIKPREARGYLNRANSNKKEIKRLIIKTINKETTQKVVLQKVKILMKETLKIRVNRKEKEDNINNKRI